MEDWKLKRYNEGQESFVATRAGGGYIKLNEKVGGDDLFTVSSYEFFFNREIKFAEAFWGNDFICKSCGEVLAVHSENGKCICDQHFVPTHEYHLEKMVVFKGPIDEYINKFKSEKNKKLKNTKAIKKKKFFISLVYQNSKVIVLTTHILKSFNEQGALLDAIEESKENSNGYNLCTYSVMEDS